MYAKTFQVEWETLLKQEIAIYMPIPAFLQKSGRLWVDMVTLLGTGGVCNDFIAVVLSYFTGRVKFAKKGRRDSFGELREDFLYGERISETEASW